MANETTKDITSFVGLKVIAVMIVFIHHSHILTSKINLGARMCEFFFVVSGFLVAYNFLKKGINTNIQSSFQYWYKKFIQFYPIHFVTFIISMFLLFKFNLIFFICNLFLIQTWALDYKIYYSYNGVSWFLSDLLLCYFLAPMFMFFVKKPIKNVVYLLLFVLFIRVALEILPDIINYKLWYIKFEVNPIIRFLEFFAGMLLVPIFNNIKIIFNNTFNKRDTICLLNLLEIIAFLTALFLCIKTSFYRCYYIPFFCLFVLIFAFNCGILSKLFSSRIFLFLGSFQFVFFMTHQMFIRIFQIPHMFIQIPNIYLNRIVVLLITMLASYLYLRFLDKKLVSLFNKLMLKVKKIINPYFSIQDKY